MSSSAMQSEAAETPVQELLRRRHGSKLDYATPYGFDLTKLIGEGSVGIGDGTLPEPPPTPPYDPFASMFVLEQDKPEKGRLIQTNTSENPDKFSLSRQRQTNYDNESNRQWRNQEQQSPQKAFSSLRDRGAQPISPLSPSKYSTNKLKLDIPSNPQDNEISLDENSISPILPLRNTDSRKTLAQVSPRSLTNFYLQNGADVKPPRIGSRISNQKLSSLPLENKAKHHAAESADNDHPLPSDLQSKSGSKRGQTSISSLKLSPILPYHTPPEPVEDFHSAFNTADRSVKCYKRQENDPPMEENDTEMKDSSAFKSILSQPFEDKSAGNFIPATNNMSRVELSGRSMHLMAPGGWVQTPYSVRRTAPVVPLAVIPETNTSREEHDKNFEVVENVSTEADWSNKVKKVTLEEVNNGSKESQISLTQPKTRRTKLNANKTNCSDGTGDVANEKIGRIGNCKKEILDEQLTSIMSKFQLDLQTCNREIDSQIRRMGWTEQSSLYMASVERQLQQRESAIISEIRTSVLGQGLWIPLKFGFKPNMLKRLLCSIVICELIIVIYLFVT